MSTNVFDIIGPVMIGPSSSHTAGAVRLGLITREILGSRPKKAVISLHGSFAKTGVGHGTDKAIAGGLLGYEPADPRIRSSLQTAAELHLDYQFKNVDLGDVHPNTVLIELWSEDGKQATVSGSSVGGGAVKMESVNGMDVSFNAEYSTLVIPHKDEPGVIAAVTSILAEKNVNIARMKIFRKNRGGIAYMIIETERKPIS